MKKIFTLIASALLGLCTVNAQNGVVELSWDTMVKNETGDNAADQTNTEFWADEAAGTKTGFILTREDGSSRTQAKTTREECSKVLNAKNNTVQKLIIPAGTKVYKINFYGWSQGDNWTYIYAYGPSSSEYEWTDPIGTGIMDNKTIIEQAKYPLDPCVVVAENAKDGYSPAYHNAGYCFASLDFTDEAYEGEFCFTFNGNNQERFWMVIYTTKEAAATAPSPEPVVQDKSQSQTIFIDAAAEREANIRNNTIELSWSTMVKDEAGENAADQTLTEFWFDEANSIKSGFVLTREDGSSRTQAQTIRQGCGNVLNAKNNTVQKLIIPADKKIYKINFYGWSQGDNWTYLYGYGPSSSDYEWTDPIGSGIMDNKVIIEQAKYPLDPCVVIPANAKDGYSPAYHQAGYCFASLDFNQDTDGDGIADPYEGEFCFTFNGNNQERFWMVVYTSPEAAAQAPQAEPVVQENPTQQMVGLEDNSTGWWSAFSDYYNIPANKTLHVEFTNYSNMEQNWFNWLAVLADREREAEGYGADVEYLAVRADNYGWGKCYDGTKNENDWNWDTFRSDMNGAMVKMDIARLDADVNITANVTTSDKATHVQKYAANLGSTDANVVAFLSVEGGHLVIDKTSISLTDTPRPIDDAVKSINVQPATSNAVYNIAGQKVNNSYKGLVIKNGKKYVVK